MKFAHFFVALFFLISSTASVYSQNESIRPQNVKIASPNAAALGKVADVPIGYHTGTPNIEIPIYTVQEGPIHVPISIAYHASGLTVMEQASWVGAGWSLNAGGVITRAVRGRPDEILSNAGGTSATSYLDNKGYFDYLFMSNPSEWQPPILPPDPDDNAKRQILATHEFAQGRLDGEPDMFNFNFNGYSGKFFFRPDNSVVITPQQDIKVTALLCGDNNSNCVQNSEELYGWIVTTPDGVRYHFGRDLTVANYNSTDNAIPLESTTTYSATSGLAYNNKTASSWFLYKIESPDKKYTVSLLYSAENYAYYTISHSPTPTHYGAPNTIDLVKNIIEGVRLTSIKFSNNGRVSFIPSFVRKDLSGPHINLIDFDPDSLNADAPRMLGAIKISNGADSGTCPTTGFSQSIIFDYGYFYDNSHPLTGYMATKGNQYNIHSDKRRLKLKSMTEQSCDGSISKPPHKFSYFDEASVPRTLSFAQDHWGFYNGKTSNASMLPPISVNKGLTNLSAVYGDRDSKWPEMRAGSLEKIQYPTGGNTRFVFESHNVRVPVNIYDSVEVGNKSANFTQTSGIDTFSLKKPHIIKARINFPYYPSGSANIHIINKNTNIEYGPIATQGLHIFQLPAGFYEFSVQSTWNSFQPTECKLFRIDTVRQEMQSVVVGGLRIDSLVYDDATNHTPKIKTFSYVDDNGVDQGVLFSRPAYVATMKNYIIKEHGGMNGTYYQLGSFDYTNGCIHGNPDFYNPADYLYYVSANAVLPLVTSQGNHFGYNAVTEVDLDGGYTEYRFKPSANPHSDVCVRVIDRTVCHDSLPNYPPAPEPFNPERGELISKSVFNSSKALLYKELYQNNYEYEQVGVRSLLVKPLFHGTHIDAYGFSSTTTFGLTTEYEWKSARKTSSTTKSYTYDASNPSGPPIYKKTETVFGSTRHLQPTHIKVSDGDGKILSEVKNTFAADLTIPSCPELQLELTIIDGRMLYSLDSLHFLYNSGSCGTQNSVCKLENWLRYTYYANNVRKLHVNRRIALMNDYEECMNNQTTAWNWSSASPELRAIVKLKNRNQVNAIVERSLWRDGMFLSAESITYQDFGNDSLSYFPGKLSLIQTATPLSANNFTPISLTNTSVTRDSKYKDEEAYQFKTGNISEVLGASGVKTSYLWGYNNSQPIAQAVNASPSQVYHDSFETTNGTEGDSKTGSMYYAGGVYIIPFTAPSDGAVYKMTYWYWSNNKWNFSEELPFNQSINSGGTKLDEIRVYPKGAQLTTYTYDVLVGITSQTDANNFTSYYVYDKLGRLQFIKDDQGNVVRKMEYNYKN